jgi:hypothetical protein
VDALRAAWPDEIYQPRDDSFVPCRGFSGPDGGSHRRRVTRMLEAMREVCPEARFCEGPQAKCSGR